MIFALDFDFGIYSVDFTCISEVTGTFSRCSFYSYAENLGLHIRRFCSNLLQMSKSKLLPSALPSRCGLDVRDSFYHSYLMVTVKMVGWYPLVVEMVGSTVAYWVTEEKSCNEFLVPQVLIGTSSYNGSANRTLWTRNQSTYTAVFHAQELGTHILAVTPNHNLLIALCTYRESDEQWGKSRPIRPRLCFH